MPNDDVTKDYEGTVKTLELDDMGVDTEQIYDEQIAPLMSKIIKICRKHRIPTTATFEYRKGHFCSTFIPFRDESAVHQPARDMIRHGLAAFAVTRKGREDKIS